MKSTHFLFKKSTWLFKCLLLATLVVSCGGDDDGPGPTEPTPDAPTLSIQGDNAIIVKTGETISVDLTLNAPGSNKELVVNRGGGLLETISLDAAATSFTYNTETVPADAEEGDEIEYEFILVDSEDQESSPIVFTVSTTAYDMITVGGQDLFNITITTDIIVPVGTSLKLITGRDYFLGASLLFEEGTALNIEEGVTLYIDAEATDPIEIRVDSNANISVIGTASDPVVFTSSATLTGTAEPGDWDRFRLGEVQNGTFQYVRSEYATEGLRFGGVDDTNTVDHIASFFADDEGIYITGGNVNIKYMVAVNSAGGSFRIGDTYSGKIQFAIGQIDQVFSDNEELDVREASSPTLSNVTLIGPGSDQEDTHGARLRASSQGKVYNSVVTAFPRRGIRLNDDVIVTDLNGETVFAYSFVFDVPKDPYRDDTDNGNPFKGTVEVDDSITNPFFNNLIGTAEVDDGEGGLETVDVFESIPGMGTDDFIPDATVTAKENHDPSTVDAFFTSVTFVGAVENAENDWTTGWVKNPDGTIR